MTFLLLFDMRVCETLYYHCIDDSKYIQEIKGALKEIGLELFDETTQFKYELKSSFKESDIYKKGYIFVNSLEKKKKSNIKLIPKEDIYIFKDLRKHSYIENLFNENDNNIDNNGKNTIYNIEDLYCNNKNIVEKAVRQFWNLDFNQLKEKFPELESYSQFFKEYINGYKFEICTYSDPTIIDIYEGLLCFFEKLSKEIYNIKDEYIGSDLFEPLKLSDKIVDITREKIIKDNLDYYGEGVSQINDCVSDLQLNLEKCNWYVYNDNFGTTEEKKFVKFFNDNINILEKKYNEIYLIRNERFISLYSFNEGKRFEPDYILILKNKNENKIVFIEPKGQHLLLNDAWKEEFLLELKEKVKEQNYNNEKYKIEGLPFFNAVDNEQLKKFKKSFFDL